MAENRKTFGYAFNKLFLGISHLVFMQIASTQILSGMAPANNNEFQLCHQIYLGE